MRWRWQQNDTDHHTFSALAADTAACSSRPRRPVINTASTCILLLILVAAFAALYNTLRSTILRGGFFSRGSSCPQLDMSGYLCAPNGARPEVAYERGCEWDPISFHWYRRERVEDPDNQELIRGFLEAGPWHRFYDAEGTVEVDPANRVLTTLWLTKREHVVHCMYTLRQTHLWLAKGFDPPFNYSHTIHCTSYLVNIILESPVPDMDKLTVHAVPYPSDWQVVSTLWLTKGMSS
ncbi:hypothetical protein CH063_07950 [Colletotrichum higginsianum]|uniref:Uncharacterized protein n=2 Tax=Colletotrichum higginsianum (strain IMI 349063) TaxID=759273 RepID=H1V810_COLHI|nr:hypothetical protein CH063_07950 [Colletotrichum higginsianum]